MTETIIKLLPSQLDTCLSHARTIVAYYDKLRGSNNTAKTNGPAGPVVKAGSAGTAGTGGIYNHNKVGSNMVGVKGEFAVSQWLKDSQVANVYDAFLKFQKGDAKTVSQGEMDDGDIIVTLDDGLENADDPKARKILIEVKSVQPHQWGRLGRMIPPRQLEKYVRKNSIVVWATATNDMDENVTIYGWNYASDVKKLGMFMRTICDNIWLQDVKHVRPMAELLSLCAKKAQKD